MGSVGLSSIGVIAAIAAVICLSYEGYEPVVCFPIVSMFICISSGIGLETGIVQIYCTSFGTMAGRMLFTYLWATMIGRAMQETGMARSLAVYVSRIVPAELAPTTICVMGVLLSLAGMSVGAYMVVYPIGLTLCEKADYSEDIILGSLFSGSWTFTMAAPWMPTNSNYLISSFLHTSPDAGRIPGMAACTAMLLLNCLFLQRTASRWRRQGRRYSGQSVYKDPGTADAQTLPPAWKSALPLLLILILYNAAGISLPFCLGAGTLACCILEYRRHTFRGWVGVLSDGMLAGTKALMNIGTKGAFGGVVAATPAYSMLMTFLTGLRVSPYLTTFLSTALLSLILGSGTSACGILVPAMQPAFDSWVSAGLADIGNLHRAAAIGSVCLDALPHNGTILAACEMFGTSMKKSYYPVFVTCNVIPLICGLTVMLPLMQMGFR